MKKYLLCSKHIYLLFLSLSLISCHSNIQTAKVERSFKDKDIPIVITYIYSTMPHSAGGVHVYINFVNTSYKTINYVTFYVTPYDNVGNVAPSRIGGKRTTSLRSTGPYRIGEGNASQYWTIMGYMQQSHGYWTNVWYNHSIRCIEVDRVSIEYRDGEKITIDKDYIYKLTDVGVRNRCR